VLLLNALLGIIGIYISILLCKGKIKVKLFLIVTFVLWFITPLGVASTLRRAKSKAPALQNTKTKIETE
jgi:hypothetical protein